MTTYCFFRRFLCIILIPVLLFVVLPFKAHGEGKPWDAYSQYIQEETPAAKRHLRGVWISTVLNLDWPSLDARNTVNDEERIQKSKAELKVIFDKVVELNMNAVFFQVSPEGDAFYKSNVVPWSRYLTGTFGKDPGFDPLAFAIEEAHKRNLEIHAWFNPYRISMNIKDITKASLNIEKSVYREHMEWIRTASDRFVVDPGIPEARKWVIDRVMEVAANYDVDGIHFDDYFYYEKFEGELKDQYTFNSYNDGQFSNLGDWRRNNTYMLVKGLSSEIRASRPWVKFGISPAGVWGNKKDGHLEGSNTNTSYNTFSRCFADTKRWVEEELVDYIAPQVYFSFANPNAPYGEVASWWAGVCRDKNVHLYVGQAFYKINDDYDQYFKGENAVEEFARQLKFNAAVPGIMGSIMFRVQSLYNQNKQHVISDMKNNLWANKALVPVMEWKGGTAPQSPTNGMMDSFYGCLRLSWVDNDPNTSYYAVYRFKNNENVDITSDASSRHLIGTIRKSSVKWQEFIDGGAYNPREFVYVVTALDRLHNESSGLTISIK